MQLTKSNQKEFTRVIAFCNGNSQFDSYFGRAISAMHRAASGRQQQAIIEEIQRLGMTHTIKELTNGSLVSADEMGEGEP